MNINFENIIYNLKKTKTADVVYPGIFILFLIATVTTFFFATRFITSNVNDVFSTEGDTGGGALERERYALVAKKLNISLISPESAVQETVPTEGAVSEPAATTTVATTSPAVTKPPLDKKAITIIVNNSTAKKGLASILAKELETAGFSTPKTGNETGHFATTTILIKESKRDYASALLEVVAKTYPLSFATTTRESASYDATIIIGEK